MYRRCLFCHGDLGANEALEAFPVGRRVAYDAAKGRLWVVCPACERWNLTPLDARWEAMEEAERLYRDTRLRVATDNVGLARLRDGTELVRVGRPLRPEMAAWRYGDQFGRRRRRGLAAVGVGAAAAVAAAPEAVPALLTGLWSGGIFVAGYVAGGVQLPYQAAKEWLLSERVLARVPLGAAGDGAGTVGVRVRHARESALVPAGPDGVALRLAHDGGESLLEGAAATRALGVLLARANAWGAAAPQVREAVRAIDERGDALSWLHTAARRSSRPGGRVMAEWRRVGAFALTPVERLAVEMALHEDAERRVLEGELALLEDAWRDAEEVAAIADGL
ncbi:hypothetical protein [Roseisolibacter sp. H3M3-2]|uniref:hypothetical protein n=1 Tax=Roseisolibacter sp. H3M3-2 TaxID=3031323 RepID=UPI0023DB739F|nr:hypothetical protein [Roseisolibacter sp. H3M3-2]MDF1503829.1 hypothetical protein [Roseisolibacter sp. H3M3-2]